MSRKSGAHPSDLHLLQQLVAPEFEHDIRREHEQRHEVEDRDLVDEDPREEGVRELTDVELVEIGRAHV